MTTEKVISRVKKLMALANGTHSTEEAQSALVMAQRLLAENGMTEKDLVEDEVVVVHGEVYRTKRRDTPSNGLANVVAENFRCLAYWAVTETSWSSRTGRQRNTEYALTFVGLPEDAEVAAATFRTARAAMNRLADEFFEGHAPRRYMHPKTARNSYLLGWVAGLDAKFSAAKQEDESLALAIITPKVVQDEFNGVRLKKGKKPQWRNFDHDASQAGYADGNQFGSAIRSSNPA